jgi:hypothetical protein
VKKTQQKMQLIQVYKNKKAIPIKLIIEYAVTLSKELNI